MKTIIVKTTRLWMKIIIVKTTRLLHNIILTHVGLLVAGSLWRFSIAVAPFSLFTICEQGDDNTIKQMVKKGDIVPSRGRRVTQGVLSSVLNVTHNTKYLGQSTLNLSYNFIHYVLMLYYNVLHCVIAQTVYSNSGKQFNVNI